MSAQVAYLGRRPRKRQLSPHGVLLDASGWFAALRPKEASHRAAYAAYASLIEGGVPLVTTNLVAAEMQVLLMRFRSASTGLDFLASLHQDPSHEVVIVDRDLERAAVNGWLRKLGDKQISLADAVSFEVMRQRCLRRALARNAHVRMAGFALMP